MYPKRLPRIPRSAKKGPSRLAYALPTIDCVEFQEFLVFLGKLDKIR